MRVGGPTALSATGNAASKTLKMDCRNPAAGYPMVSMTRPAPALATLLLVTAVLPPLAAAPIVLLDDDFNDLSNWTDLSVAVNWGDAGSPDSAFLTTNGELRINSTAQPNPSRFARIYIRPRSFENL
jgi:hypothetical protein